MFPENDDFSIDDTRGWKEILVLPIGNEPMTSGPSCSKVKFNPGFFFLCSKAFSRIIFSVIFRASNHQLVELKLKCFLAFKFGPSCSKLGYDNPGLVRDLNSDCFKSISLLILFVYKLMIGSSKNNSENYPSKCFRIPEKETGLNLTPG